MKVSRASGEASKTKTESFDDLVDDVNVSQAWPCDVFNQSGMNQHRLWPWPRPRPRLQLPRPREMKTQLVISNSFGVSEYVKPLVLNINMPAPKEPRKPLCLPLATRLLQLQNLRQDQSRPTQVRKVLMQTRITTQANTNQEATGQ